MPLLFVLFLLFGRQFLVILAFIGASQIQHTVTNIKHTLGTRVRVFFSLFFLFTFRTNYWCAVMCALFLELFNTLTPDAGLLFFFYLLY